MIIGYDRRTLMIVGVQWSVNSQDRSLSLRNIGNKGMKPAVKIPTNDYFEVTLIKRSNSKHVLDIKIGVLNIVLISSHQIPA